MVVWMQIQTAVTGYYLSKQILLVGFAGQVCVAPQTQHIEPLLA